MGELVRHVEQVRDGHGEVVTIGFDEIVSGDRRGIDVVLAKRTQEVAADERHVHRAPRIRTPMDDT